MSFDLRITVTGMCLFVPDNRTAGAPRMRVLLPDMSNHVNHSARLLYDHGYIATTPPTPRHDLTRSLKCHKLDRQRLVFPGTNASLELPGEIVDLAPTGARIDASVIDNSPPPADVVSHIELGAGAVSDYELGAAFDYNGSTLPMTFQVHWTIRNLTNAAGEDKLEWSLTSLDNPANHTPLDTLVPIGGEVHVLIYHTTPLELPGHPVNLSVPSFGNEVKHFRAFYKLATGGSVSAGPTFNGTLLHSTDCPSVLTGRRGAAFRGHTISAAGRGGSPFTCMPATAPIG